MKTSLLVEVDSSSTPETLAASLASQSGVVLLRSAGLDSPRSRTRS